MNTTKNILSYPIGRAITIAVSESYVLFTPDSFARLWKFNNNIVMIKLMPFL